MIIKICGITTEEDARRALAAGADWVGLNAVGGPRQLSLDAVTGLASVLPTDSVTVLLDAARCHGAQECVTRLRAAGVKRLQVYGDVTADLYANLAALGFAVIHVLHVDDEATLTGFRDDTWPALASKPTYVLLDPAVAGKRGGTGSTLDWRMIAKWQETLPTGFSKIILAGGLTPENVAEAVRATRPSGVDVSSGVEVSPGRKDSAKVSAFVKAIRAAKEEG